jgi:chitodextrinase
MNLLNPYIHSKKLPNTFIGGVGATITNRAQLVAKLTGIVESDIKGFSIDANNNVSCYIGKDFGIAPSAFDINQSSHPTYFIHLGLYLKTVNERAFYTLNNSAQSRLRLFITAAELSIAPPGGVGNVFDQRFHRLEVFACPNCIWLGSTTADNANFLNNRNNLWLYANPILATIAGGNPDGDIVYVEGGTNSVVKYSANFDAPQPISAVSFDVVGGTFLNISWSDQAHSNSIDWQLMFLNGNYIGRVAGGVEEYQFTGLTPNTEYEVKILTIDQSGNSSLFSKAFKQTTAATPGQNIELAVDSFGGTYIKVGWTDNLPFAVDSYRIYVDGVLNKTVAGGVEEYLFTGLTPNTEYDIQVRAVLGGTEVSTSNTITQTTGSNTYSENYTDEYEAMLDYAIANNIEIPKVTQRVIDDALITQLKVDGIFSDFVSFYFAKSDYPPLPASHNFYTLNWKNPGSFTLYNPTEALRPDFVPNKGWISGNRGSGNHYFLTGVMPSSHLTQMDCAVFFKTFDYTSGVQLIAGARNSNNQGQIFIETPNLLRVFTAVNATGYAGNEDKHTLTYRLGSDARYRVEDNNEVNIGVSGTSNLPTSHELAFLGFNNNGTISGAAGGFGISYLGILSATIATTKYQELFDDLDI